MIELEVIDPDLNDHLDLSLKCENTPQFPDTCNFLGFEKNLLKSKSFHWFGTLKAFKKFDYLQKTVYQFFAVAFKTNNVYTRVVFELRVLPNLNKAPLISSSSLLFTVHEKQPEHTIIGKLELRDEYDSYLKSLASFSIVYDLEEIKENVESVDLTDLNFGIVKNHLQLTKENELQTIRTINRDSNVFTDLDGLIYMWVKVFYKTNPNIVNYYKVRIFFCLNLISKIIKFLKLFR